MGECSLLVVDIGERNRLRHGHPRAALRISCGPNASALREFLAWRRRRTRQSPARRFEATSSAPDIVAHHTFVAICAAEPSASKPRWCGTKLHRVAAQLVGDETMIIVRIVDLCARHRWTVILAGVLLALGAAIF